MGARLGGPPSPYGAFVPLRWGSLLGAICAPLLAIIRPRARFADKSKVQNLQSLMINGVRVGSVAISATALTLALPTSTALTNSGAPSSYTIFEL